MLVNCITRFRNLAAGLAMLGFVVALELEDLVDPTNAGSTSERLQRVADHPTRLVVASALLFLSSALLIPTLATLRGLVRDRRRGRRLMTAATAIWTLGALGHAAEIGYYAVVGAAASHRTPQVVATLGGAGGDAAGAVVGIGVACFALGCLLTIAALVRSGIATRWLLLAIVAGIAGQPIGKALGIRAFDLGQLAAVAPLLWLGWRLTISGAHTSPQPLGRLEPALET